jgi:hypothetical protein
VARSAPAGKIPAAAAQALPELPGTTTVAGRGAPAADATEAAGAATGEAVAAVTVVAAIGVAVTAVVAEAVGGRGD